MPTRPETRAFFPTDWPIISAAIRFDRAGGRCEQCGRPHGERVRCLADGRWWDADAGTWRDRHGRPASWPDIVEACQVKEKAVRLACCHIDHDPANNAPENLRALCQPCHLLHARPHHLRQVRITVMLRRAAGDLFLGPYRRG
ncbi:hypothetical protein [Azospirillum sp. sgz302134]